MTRAVSSTCSYCGAVMRPGEPLHFLVAEFCRIPAPDGFRQDHDYGPDNVTCLRCGYVESGWSGTLADLLATTFHDEAAR